MAEMFEYTTKENQRFDQVANAAYGCTTLVIDGETVSSMQPIIEANPDVSIADKLPAGTVLKIPLQVDGNLKTDAEKLPPWKRDGQSVIV
jgi:hypothetical protein